MAIAVGSHILSADMQSWYTRLNAILSAYGGGVASLATLAVPAAGKRAEASDVNNICYKFNSMKSDSYLGADLSLYTTYTTVSVGQLITPLPGQQINKVLDNLAVIKCRNNAKNSYGSYQTANTYGNSNTANNNTWNQTAKGNTWAQSSYSNTWAQAANGNTWNQAANGNGNSNVQKNNGYSYWDHSNGYSQTAKTYDRKSVSGNYYSNQCSFWGQSGKKTNGWSNSAKGNGNTQSVNTNTWAQGANSNGWGQGANTNGCNQNANNNGWNQGLNTNGNAQSANSNTWNQGTNTNGTTIDIKNARSTLSK